MPVTSATWTATSSAFSAWGDCQREIDDDQWHRPIASRTPVAAGEDLSRIPGNGHSFGGEYQELVPGELIRYTDSFDDPQLPGEMQVTVSLRPVSCGTEVAIIQQGIPAVIPLEMCYLGWQESLLQLANLVEPEIPD